MPRAEDVDPDRLAEFLAVFLPRLLDVEQQGTADDRATEPLAWWHAQRLWAPLARNSDPLLMSYGRAVTESPSTNTFVLFAWALGEALRSRDRLAADLAEPWQAAVMAGVIPPSRKPPPPTAEERARREESLRQWEERARIPREHKSGAAPSEPPGWQPVSPVEPEPTQRWEEVASEAARRERQPGIERTREEAQRDQAQREQAQREQAQSEEQRCVDGEQQEAFREEEARARQRELEARLEELVRIEHEQILVGDLSVPGTGDRKADVAAPSAPSDRYVNVAVLPTIGARPLAPDNPLIQSSAYYLRLDIGARSVESVSTAGPIPPLPEDVDGHWLEIAVSSTDFVVPAGSFRLYLPRSGSSYLCQCRPRRPHHCTPAERQRYLFIPVTAPPTPGSARLRIAVYWENNVLQSLVLTADVVAHKGLPGTHHATDDFTLVDDLRAVSDLRPRTASVLVNQSGGDIHTLLFKEADTAVSMHFTEGQLTKAMGAARDKLLAIHAVDHNGDRENLLQAGNRKGREAFVADLESLAYLGWDLWCSLRPQAGEPLQSVRDAESATLQVARVPSTTSVFPWSVVYDRYMAGPPYERCRLLEEWDDATRPLFTGYPASCPYAHEHPKSRKNVLCPFDFWAFRYIIEQPASTNGGALPLEVRVRTPAEIAIARSSRLDDTVAGRHLIALAAALPEFELLPPAESRDAVGVALANPDLELIYFYCHGGGAEGAIPWLEVGESDHVEPRDITGWDASDWSAVPQHWRLTHPLVFLNGCHTAELLPQSPINFVDQFACAAAGGVIGTEIALEQEMASEAAEVLFAAFAGPDAVHVGEAVRRMRLHFLAKGNLLGLAYTPYCAADLRLVRG